MTFEVKGLATPPDLTFNKSHYYCDYIELVALLSSDDLVSQQDIYERFYDSGVINEETVNSGSNDDWIGSSVASEYIQKWNDRISRWFNTLSIRNNNYGSFYPFEITHNTIKLKENLTGSNKVYIGLLLSSCNNYHNKQPLFTSVFEEISKIAMQGYLGTTASVHCFGVSSLASCRYRGSLETKMTKLADDIEYELTGKRHIFKDGDNGDGGVDIVAWLPFPNDINLSRKQLFLGQSATGKNWDTKQGSVSRVKNYIYIPDSTLNVLFVPYDLRDMERRFEEEGNITASIVFDRYRILSLINDSDVWQSEKGIDFQTMIESAIQYEDDLV